MPYNWLRIISMNPTAEPSKPGMAGRRILIVDDDRLNTRILASILKPEGYELATVHSGEECLERYEQFKPDLVLLDVIMPGITGFETCRTLRERHGDALAPVIFITAKSESDGVVEGLAAGGVDYQVSQRLPRGVRAPRPHRAKPEQAPGY